MVRNLRISLFIAWGVASATLSEGQHLDDATIRKIDELFSAWNIAGTPGYGVGVVKDDSLIFTKGYGMANLEYHVPITASTVFYVASVSKQFTAYCITLLVRQKKVNPEQDIRVYLPWFPDLKRKITVENLLHHTSGIRDDLNMVAISGLGIDGTLTNDQVVRMLKKQRGLNFNPGERYSYSNSNYILLSEIVKAVSGRSLREFADSAIFKPLGMANTHFHDDPSELVEERAVSYLAAENGNYHNAPQNIYTVGDGGLMTTVKDASKWIANFYNPRAGDARDIDALTKTGKLSGGKELSYASGIAVTEHAGWKVYSHAGGLHGYSAIVSVYPELKTGFIIFGNVRKGNIHQMVNALATLIIEPKKSAKNTTATKPKSIDKDSVYLKNYIGDYISDDGYLLRISWKDGKLSGTGFGQYFETSGKENNNTYWFPSKNNPLTKIVTIDGTRLPEFNLEFPDEILHFTLFDKTITIDPAELVGDYYCEELGCTYTISLKDGELFLSGNVYPESKLLLRETHLKRDSWFMSHLRIIREQNKVTGFEVNSGNVMHLPFKKVTQTSN